MKSVMPALAMAGMLTVAAHAQSPTGAGATVPVSPLDEEALAPAQVGSERPKTKQSRRDGKPAPAAPAVNRALVNQLEAAMKAPATEPVEPYLLTKDSGPFMVLAKTFRGPDAERFAIALVKELRTEFGLPAYILRPRDFANRRLGGNPVPVAPAGQAEANAGNQKKNRTSEECAVLVGDEKTLEASETLLHRVKGLKPVCLDALPHVWNNRRHLKNAIRTTNPLARRADVFRRQREKAMIEAKPNERGKLDPPQDPRLMLLVFPPVDVK